MLAKRFGQFVAVSELSVPAAGVDAVGKAFRNRLGAVDAWPGFQGLEVLRDLADETSLIMISYWDSKECFSSYMRSEDHCRSHERIPDGDMRPKPVRFRRFEVVAE